MTIVECDDLERGMYVAVYGPIGPAEPEGLRALQESRSAGGKTIRPGLPLRVLEVCLPFLAAASVNPDGTYRGPVILDLRKIKLCRLSKEFIDAVTCFGSSKEK